jgi:hypothetical protein
MPRVSARVPELSEVLCFSCGYVLDGLPETGLCPECGNPISASLGADRQPPDWETAERPHRISAFLRTSARIIFRPGDFYRTLNVRGPIDSARRFARFHWLISALLFGVAGAAHAIWFSYFVAGWLPDVPGGKVALFAALALLLTALAFGFLDFITRVAAKLTNVEATYRGIRLPYNIVLRGMYYHAAHYLPVGIAAFVYVLGFQILARIFNRWLPINSDMYYLYGLCALVVLCAIYLFQTYWIGMRNMMYANR